MEVLSKKRHRWICRYCRGGIASQELQFECSPSGKPWLVSEEGVDEQGGKLHFNLTHTERLLGQLCYHTFSPPSMCPCVDTGLENAALDCCQIALLGRHKFRIVSDPFLLWQWVLQHSVERV